jgi:hypothetical protein
MRNASASQHAVLARELLLSSQKMGTSSASDQHIAMAQVEATLAVAEALDGLASHVEHLTGIADQMKHKL